MFLLKIIFWLGAVTVAYTFLLYPLAIAVLARLWPRGNDRSGPLPSGVSLVLAARNEQANIHRRLTELTEAFSALQLPNEIIVISDGSLDDTAAVASTFAKRGVIVINWQENRGKAAALNYGVSIARHEVILFADARQRWSADSVFQLVDCFRDLHIGAVSGELVLETEPGVLAGVGMYWKYEKWLRSRESKFDSQIGVTGAICAVRRELFCPIPEGIILDDVYWPMRVAMGGHRVIYQPEAKAFDRLPEHSGGELQRKLRTLVGNYQLITACPGLILPWKNPLWLPFISHKALRLATPWALLLTCVSSAVIPEAFYRTAFLCQVIGVAIGGIGLTSRFGGKRRLFSAAGSFLLLLLAAWLAFWYWILGRTDDLWGKPAYQPSPVDQSPKI